MTVYKVHSTIIFSGYQVSDFAGNLRAQELNKSQTKLSNITGVKLKYNSKGSTGSGVNFVLLILFYFLFVLIPNFSPSPWRLSSIAAAAGRLWNTVSDTFGQYTIADVSILRPILWRKLDFT